MIKKILPKVLCLTIAATVLFSTGVQTFAASSTENLKVKKIEQKQIELNKKISEMLDNNYGNVKLENSTIKLDLNYIESNNIDVDSKEFEQEVISEVKAFKKKFEESIQTKNSNQIKEKRVSENGTSSVSATAGMTGSYERTASVWCGVPAIGWAYINQDYKATINNGYFESIEFLGDSYKSGVSLGSWTKVRSWYELGYYKTYADIYIKGVLDYSLKTGMISTTETFLYTDSDC